MSPPHPDTPDRHQEPATRDRSAPPPPAARRSLTRTFFGAATLAGLTAWLLMVGLNEPGTYPSWFRCPLHAGTGILCPGCGSTRATHELLNARPLASLRNNPLVILLALPALAVLIRTAAARVLNREPSALTLPGWTGRAVLAAILSFWIIRNIPIALFEPLRPIDPADHTHEDHR